MKKISKKQARKMTAFSIGVIVVLTLIVQQVLRFIDYLKDNPFVFAGILIGVILLSGAFLGVNVIKIRRYLKAKKEYYASTYFNQTRKTYKDLVKEKGSVFEYQVTKKLEENLHEVALFVDFVVRRKHAINEYAEIDVIVVYQMGVFVLELKDYKGYVYGKREDKEWTVGYNAKHKRQVYTFYNPVKQNAKHIEDLLPYLAVPMKSIVVFSQGLSKSSGIEEVMNLEEAIECIKKGPVVYDAYQVKELSETLKNVQVHGTRDEHIERLKYNQTKYVRARGLRGKKVRR